MTAIPTIIDFVTDPQFLGLGISLAQETLLRAIYGLALTEEQLEIWRRCTGREAYVGEPFHEVTVIAGARSGKDSRIAVPMALYEAFFGGHEARLARGEKGIVPIVAQDQKAGRIALGYAKEYVLGSALLKQMVDEEREWELWLTNRLRLVVFASTSKSVRGWSIPAAIMDEVAFYRIEGGADADVEIQAAIRRGMIGFGGRARLVKISTPYVKGGVLFEDFTRYYGKPEPDVLVWQASSVLMNPTLNEDRLAREYRVDPLRASREYEALFSDDVESFLPGVWIESATVEGRRELPPRDVRYMAAVDPSGGSADSFTLAIVHAEQRAEGVVFVQDLVKGWASSRSQGVDLDGVCQEIAAIVRRYGLDRVVGDHYAGKWVSQAFQRVGIYYQEHDGDKSKAYRELEPVLAQGRIELLDHPTMLRELRLLERRARIGGKPPLIDHPKGAHDDHANALAVAVAELAKSLHPAATVFGMAGQEPSELESQGAGFFGTRSVGQGWTGHSTIDAKFERIRHSERRGFWR